MHHAYMAFRSMTSYRYSMAVLATCLLIASASSSALALPVSGAQSTSISFLGDKFSDDYAGINVERNSVTDIAALQMQIALQYYYKIYEHWPTSWQDIVDVGIFQVPLRGFHNEVIDPDDSKLDFEGDLFYDALSSTGDKAKIRELILIDGMSINYIDVPHYATYNEQLTALADYVSYAPWFLERPERLRYLAILGMCNAQLLQYYHVHEHYPYTWADFINSGLAPVSWSSVNPLTGNPFYGDGRSSDVYYEYLAPDNYIFVHVGENGTFPNERFTY